MEVFTTLDQYKIEKKIHTSNFSRTVLVSDKNSGELKIMKTIFFKIINGSTQKDFLSNFYELKSMQFPTLLPYQTFAFNINSTFQPSLILDYYKNGSLYNCCKRLNNTQKMIVIVGIVEGMRYIHFNGQYHGCLEPGNIILDDYMRPLISSYGLSILSDEYDFDVFRSPFTFPSIISKIKYTSASLKSEEELHMKQAEDVFAFSMLLYFILTNETPLQKKCTTCQKRIEMFIRGFRPQLPSWVPSELAKLEYECWQPDGKKRPTFKEISHRLRTCTAILPPGIDITQVGAYLKYIGDPEMKSLEINKSGTVQVNTENLNRNTNQIQVQQSNQKSSQNQSKILSKNQEFTQNSNQRKNQNQGKSPDLIKKPIQSSNPKENSETGVKKRRIFLKFQKSEDKPKPPEPQKSPEIPDPSKYTNNQKFSEPSTQPEASKKADFQQDQAILDLWQEENVPKSTTAKTKDNDNIIDQISNESDSIDYSQMYVFSDKSDRSDISESSEFNINDDDSNHKGSKSQPRRKTNNKTNKVTSKSQPYQTPKSRAKSESDSQSDSSTNFDSESESENVPFEFEQNLQEIAPEKHEQVKMQTEEGKRLILNGQVENGVQLIKKAADESYRGAILAYGCLLECGVGVKQDLRQAAAYYGRAQSMGSNNAKAAYSRFALKGLGGVKRDPAAAAERLKEAAAEQLRKWQKMPNLTFHSDMKANKKRRNLDEDDDIIEIKNPQNYKKLKLFPSKTEAIYQYAKLLKKRGKIEEDWGKLEVALKYAQIAAEKDYNIKAMNLFGEILHALGKTKQYSKAAKFFKIAADEGNSKAQFNYGNCRKEGLGIGENFEEAVRYFKMSADQKNPNGLNEYGIALQEGIGIQQNVTEAKKYIKMAADLGNADAQYNYVIMLQLKIGINTDDPMENQAAEREILEYLKKASDSDYPDAMVLYSRMIITNLDGLSQDEKINKLKEAKFYLKRTPDVCQDEGIIAESQKLLTEVKSMMNK